MNIENVQGFEAGKVFYALRGRIKALEINNQRT